MSDRIAPSSSDLSLPKSSQSSIRSSHKGRIMPLLDPAIGDSLELEQSIEVPPPLSEQLLGELGPQVENSVIPSDIQDPRLHVNQFSPGHHFESKEDETLRPVEGADVPFIPLDLAMDYVKKMEFDMISMHNNSKEALVKIDKCYADIEIRTHDKYRQFIDK